MLVENQKIIKKTIINILSCINVKYILLNKSFIFAYLMNVYFSDNYFTKFLFYSLYEYALIKANNSHIKVIFFEIAIMKMVDQSCLVT